MAQRGGSGAPAAALFQQAVQRIRAGDLEAALRFASQALTLDPRHPGALQLSAEVWARRGDPRQAADLLRRVPGSARDWRVAANLGSALAQLGDLAGAERQFRLALKDKADLAVLHFNLGNALHRQSRGTEAESSYRRSLALDPDFLECRLGLASLLGERGGRDEALALLRGAAARAPARAEVAVSLGQLLKAMGDRGEAESWFRRALELRPDIVPAQLDLARLLADSGRLDEAEAWLRRASGHAHASPEVTLALGSLYRELGRLREAEPLLRAAVSARAGYGRGLLELALVLDRLGKHEESERLQQEFLALTPATSADWEGRGKLLLERGQQDEAVECYRRALQLDPANAGLHAALIWALGYLPGMSPAQLFQEHVEWAMRHAGRIPPLPEVRAEGAEARRLRLGYLSPDLREHSVAYFLEPVLARHDHGAFEVFCYSTGRVSDDVTARLRRHADHWVEANALSDEELARKIRDDRIDVLVDLAGFTLNHRLGVLARKPAPVQVTWLGYSNTTGLRQVDWRLTDELADPPGEADALSGERLLRLRGGFCCYLPRSDAPEPGAVPCARNGHVTFGCFNNPDKVNDRVIRLWSRLLREVPDSRLILKGNGLEVQARRRRLEERFRGEGVDPARVELRGWTGNAVAHLAEYADVDIALDPFPYNGVTTTCEALWMGVPVIVLAGDRHAGRTGMSLLTRAGVPELVADSEEKYVELALALARDPARLGRYRAGLREQMRASPLLDGEAFTRLLEDALRAVWTEECRRAASPAAEGPDAEQQAFPAGVTVLAPGAGEEGMTAILPGGARLRVPRSARLMTPYVLMEQGDWFEDEIRFVRRLLLPGFEAVDVGANHGVYALSIAVAVGESGRVWAFEPASATCSWLQRSAELNPHANLTVLRAALSDHEGTAQLILEGNSELNRLGRAAAPGQQLEEVPLRTLDRAQAELGWSRIAFLKIDAEGEEARIVEGGRGFLDRQSPVVMVELRHGGGINTEVFRALESLEYRTYRLVPGLDLLVPFDFGQAADAFLLNLFCLKQERAAELQSRGLLAAAEEPPAGPARAGRDAIAGMPFARQLAAGWGKAELDGAYARALDLLVTALEGSGAPGARWGALVGACKALEKSCEERPSDARLATLSRAWFAGGWRQPALQLLDRLRSRAESGATLELDEPFLPPCPRFSGVEPRGPLRDWFVAAVIEQQELLGHFSSYFTGEEARGRIAELRRLGYLTPALEVRERLVTERFLEVAARAAGQATDATRQ